MKRSNPWLTVGSVETNPVNDFSEFIFKLFGVDRFCQKERVKMKKPKFPFRRLVAETDLDKRKEWLKKSDNNLDTF